MNRFSKEAEEFFKEARAEREKYLKDEQIRIQQEILRKRLKPKNKTTFNFDKIF